MRKLVRDIVAIVRASGGCDVWISEGSRHTRVHFTTETGRHTFLVSHRGNIVTSRHLAMIRSQMRRKNDA